MTLTLSSVSNDSNLIVMLSDSARINYTPEGSEVYDKSRKFCAFSGVGCVTTWGKSSGMGIEAFLLRQDISPDKHTVEDLRNMVEKYLKDELRPAEDDSRAEVGYHVGGFDRSYEPRLYHLFWASNKPAHTAEDALQKYRQADHSAPGFLFNGRNDLGWGIIYQYLKQVMDGLPTRYPINTLQGRVQFCDMVERFAAEMTPQVDLPLKINLIFPTNEILTIPNDRLCPIQLEPDVIKKLGDWQGRRYP